ncbi:MAG TPA: phosphomannomutase [Epsilonproteobacteria bacterium]|nr:phosphomannomutase [Campylobacterota bacterium]
MIITINNKQFDTSKITQLYPAAVIKTGYENETTQVSLEWLDIEAKGKVEVDGFGIFVHLGEGEKYSFMYKSRAELEEEIGKVASQLQ